MTWIKVNGIEHHILREERFWPGRQWIDGIEVTHLQDRSFEEQLAYAEEQRKKNKLALFPGLLPSLEAVCKHDA